MPIIELAKLMLQSILTSTAPVQDVLDELQNTPYFFCIAKRGTTAEDWSSKRFEAFIEDSALVVFVSHEAAQDYATYWHCVLDDMPMVYKANKEQLKRIISEYTDNGFISAVRIYALPPVCLTFSSSVCLGKEKPSASTILHDDESKPGEYQGVERVREILDTHEPNARRKLDPGQRAENIHTLVQSLVQQNKLEYEDLDRKLNMPKSYTREFCVSANGTHPSMEVLEKYLSFFGLQEYLYVYKKDCIELAKFINGHKDLDKYELISRLRPTDKRFCLTELVRGKDTRGHYVYRATLTHQDETVTFVLSNPLNKVVGREYGIAGMENQDTGVTSAPDLNEAVLSELSKSMDTQPGEKRERTYEETRKDEILYYFKRRDIPIRSAEAKYRELEIEPDILDEFYKYITKKEFGKLEIAGYSGRKLIRDMHMDPYEAYLSLVQLRTDPQNTKQRLKYRETDPQYQRKPAQSK